MRPTEQQFEFAAAWLDTNEGEGKEGESCAAVAKWLRAHMRNDRLRRIARERGVPVSALRDKLKDACDSF